MRDKLIHEYFGVDLGDRVAGDSERIASAQTADSDDFGRYGQQDERIIEHEWKARPERFAVRSRRRDFRRHRESCIRYQRTLCNLNNNFPKVSGQPCDRTATEDENSS